MDIYSIVYHGVIAQYEAMALVQDAVPGGGGTAGTMMRLQGRQIAPVYASLAQASVDRAATTGPVTPSPAGPVPLPMFSFPWPGSANPSGWPPAPGAPGGLSDVPLPGLPGAPPWPTLPFAPGWPRLPPLPGMPADMPGLDLCALLKCLAGAMPCPCKGSPAPTTPTEGTATDPIRQLTDQALGLFERARLIADAAARQAEQKVADLKAAAANASEARRRTIAAAQKLADEALREARQRGDEISTAVGTVLAGFPR